MRCVSERTVGGDRCLADRELHPERELNGIIRRVAYTHVRRESGRLVAAVELIEPDVLEEVVRDAGEGGGLIQAAELDIRRDASGDVEHVQGGVLSGWLGEERVADNRGVQRCAEQACCQIPVGLDEQSIRDGKMIDSR